MKFYLLKLRKKVKMTLNLRLFKVQKIAIVICDLLKLEAETH